MNEDVQREANEAFKRKLKELEGKARPRTDEANVPQSLAGLDTSGANICEVSANVIASMSKMLTTFSWVIPNEYEDRAKAFLFALQTVIMPAFCGTTTATRTVGTNQPQPKRQ